VAEPDQDAVGGCATVVSSWRCRPWPRWVALCTGGGLFGFV